MYRIIHAAVRPGHLYRVSRRRTSVGINNRNIEQLPVNNCKMQYVNI